MTAGGPARGPGTALHDLIAYEDAKSIFLESYPFDGDPSDPNVLDVQVRTLVAAGRYALDRWGAERRAAEGLTKPAAIRAAVEKARNSCENQQHQTLLKEAADALSSYVFRHGRLVPIPIIQHESLQFYKRSESFSWRWFWREVVAAVIAIGVLITLSTAVTLVSPKLRTEAWKNINAIFSEPVIPTTPGDAAKRL